MTEFRHPPIDTNIVRDTTLEEDFAERAYEILAQYVVTCTTITGDNELTYPVTDRTDLISTDPDVDVALRIVRTPAFAILNAEGFEKQDGVSIVLDQPSLNYMVLQLQYGTLELEDVDEDFNWHPYVMTITLPDGSVNVVNPENGHEIPAADIMQASYFMELMAKELRGVLLEAAICGADEIPVYLESLKDRYELLPEGEQLNLNTNCPACGATNRLCIHEGVDRNNPILN